MSDLTVSGLPGLNEQIFTGISKRELELSTTYGSSPAFENKVSNSKANDLTARRPSFQRPLWTRHHSENRMETWGVSTGRARKKRETYDPVQSLYHCLDDPA